MYRLCTAFKHDLCEEHGFFRCVCRSGIHGFIYLDVKSCRVNPSSNTARNAKSCKGCLFLVSAILTDTVLGRRIQDFDKYFIKGMLLIHISTKKCLCHQLFITLERRHFCRLHEARYLRFCFRSDVIGRVFLQKKLVTCGGL